jgi:hypothetical protein
LFLVARAIEQLSLPYEDLKKEERNITNEAQIPQESTTYPKNARAREKK